MNQPTITGNRDDKMIDKLNIFFVQIGKQKSLNRRESTIPLPRRNTYVNFLAFWYNVSTTLPMCCIVSRAVSYVLSTGVSSNTISTPTP